MKISHFIVGELLEQRVRRFSKIVKIDKNYLIQTASNIFYTFLLAEIKIMKLIIALKKAIS